MGTDSQTTRDVCDCATDAEIDDEVGDGCCGGGVGPVPYALCVDCPRNTRSSLTDRATKEQYLDLAGVMRRLVEATDMEGGIRPWAEARGLHASIIDHFLRGQRGPGPQLLQALGLRKVTMYRIESCSDD